MAPDEVVSRQLEFYNAHDIDGFCSTYSEGIELFNFGEGKPYLKSKGELREFYKQRFSNDKLRARIVNRMVKGKRVMDNERVVGIGDGERDLIAIYEIEGDLISKVWFIRD